MIDFDKILNEIKLEIDTLQVAGQVANYIPELSKVDPNRFGMSLHTVDDRQFNVGDSEIKFSIQSIAKVLSLTLAYQTFSGKLWNRVGVEPSGDPFNSMVQLEFENGRPRNPFINSGALVICDVLFDVLTNPVNDFLAFVRQLSKNPNINYSATVVASEHAHGFKNAAVINLMKSFGNINHDIEQVLNFYYHLCSLEMTCSELANIFLLFANGGRTLKNDSQIITRSQTKRINAIMQTCGFYDEAGEFSFLVGLPGKSGVGGGIAAVHPGEYAVAVWSPRLNPKGNSYAGMQALEQLTTKSGLSIF